MKDEGLAVAFWNRVDKLWQDRSLKDFSASTGIDYVLLLNWRTKKRLPSLEHACSISTLLGTTIEYLVTGEDPDAPAERIQQIVKRLESADDVDIELVRRVLHMNDIDDNKLQTFVG